MTVKYNYVVLIDILYDFKCKNEEIFHWKPSGTDDEKNI